MTTVDLGGEKKAKIKELEDHLAAETRAGKDPLGERCDFAAAATMPTEERGRDGSCDIPAVASGERLRHQASLCERVAEGEIHTVLEGRS